ncbi:MAG: hypothetical protein H6672_12480 [Anaerolineaceae bacterium]|nr:hypothetical protein [Anaerolineaceae bacterium]
MPRLSRYFVRSALVCLLIGFTLGGLILSVKAGVVSPLVWLWFPAHILLLLNGWLIQLALGVAYWIFPRIILTERGRTRWAWASFLAMQAGVGCVLVSLLQIWWGAASGFLGVGVLLQAAAMMLFAVHAWPRIRPAIIRPDGG